MALARALLAVLLLLLGVPAQAAAPHGSQGANTGGGGGGGGSLVMPAYNNLSTNWSNAGLSKVGGIPSRSTVCATVSPTGITPPASGDDAATINAAIASCSAGDVLMLASGTFQIAQSEYIWLNNGITLRGSGTPNSCTVTAWTISSTMCWPTVINMYNGAIADWTISSTTAGANCGVTHTSTSTCSAGTGVILVSPSGNFNWGWASCNLGSTPSGCGTTLTADAAQGATTVSVSSTSNFSAGMWALIDENPAVVTTTNPTGGSSLQASPEFLNGTGSPVVMHMEGGDIPTAFSLNPNRVNAELHLISSTGSGTLTFDDPLTMAFRQSGSHNAQVYWPTIQGANTANPFLSKAGVENLTITKAANGGVNFFFCQYCWAKNVEVGGWIGGGLNASYTARTEFVNNYIHDCFDCENNGVEYPIGINEASTEMLIDNNIIVRGGKGMVGRAANTAVVAYNYVDDTFYMPSSGIGDYWMDMAVNGSHYAGTHHWLFEGNWGDNCDNDETHGNASYHTYFRNWCTGLRTSFTDPSNSLTVNDAAGTGYSGVSNTPTQPGVLRAAGPMAFNYWDAYVGNVLGTSGQTNAAHGWLYSCYPPNSSQTNKCIWISGWTGSEWPSSDPNLNGTVHSWIFKNGNYDYYNSSVVDNASGYTQTFPNSMYGLTSKPAYFTGTNCTYPWPWVTPAGSSQIQTPTGGSCSSSDGLPAKARYDAGTPFAQP